MSGLDAPGDLFRLLPVWLLPGRGLAAPSGPWPGVVRRVRSGRPVVLVVRPIVILFSPLIAHPLIPVILIVIRPSQALVWAILIVGSLAPSRDPLGQELSLGPRGSSIARLGRPRG